MRRIENLVGRRDPKTLTADLLMEDTVVTCGPQAAAVSVALRLCDGNFGSIPVVDEERRLLGLVTEFDLLKVMEQDKDLRKVPVADIMTRDVMTTTENTSFSELIDLMQRHHLIRVPVIRDGKLVGIVARRDILHGYLTASFRHEGSG